MFLTTLAYLQSAARAGEQPQPEMQCPAPIAPPQMSPCLAGSPETTPAGMPSGSTPATAPRAPNPAAFLRNTNSIFSPDVPAAAGMGHAHVRHDPARLRGHTRTESTHSMPTSRCTHETGLRLLCLMPECHIAVACLDIAFLTQCLVCECLKCILVNCDIFTAACDRTVTVLDCDCSRAGQQAARAAQQGSSHGRRRRRRSGHQIQLGPVLTTCNQAPEHRVSLCNACCHSNILFKAV